MPPYARKAGIAPRRASDPAPISKPWLRSRYLHDNIPLTRIAAELGVHQSTAYAAAHRYGLPLRPPGLQSSSVMLARLPRSVPRDVRAAVQGTVGGWQRLQRFRAAMSFPTIEAAATSAGVDQATLVRQFHRLEHDIGAVLYTRTKPGLPMHPTRRGAALIEAFDNAQASADAIATPPEEDSKGTARKQRTPPEDGEPRTQVRYSPGQEASDAAEVT